jgi:integrase
MGVKVRERPTGSGIFWVFIDHQRKRKAKKIGRDKRLALEVAKKIEAKLALVEFNIETKAESCPTFSEYAQRWISITVPASCKASTARDYQGLLGNYILPLFRDCRADEIKRSKVRDFLEKKINESFASCTVTHMKNVISGVLNLAIDDETISVNPAHRLGKVIKSKRLQLEADPLRKEELSNLLKTFETEFPKHYPLALTLARTGMRLGEALAVKWSDIDFNSRFIKVQRGFSRGKIETPKNGKTRRVDMSRQLAECLLNLKEQRTIEGLKDGLAEIPQWVFVSDAGKPLIANVWRRDIFRKALQRAKMRKIRIHDLRHTYASLLIQTGESLAYIRDQLGHHSIKVTVDIYGHLAPEGSKAAVNRLDDPQTIATQTQPKEKGVNPSMVNPSNLLASPTGFEPVLPA